MRIRRLAIATIVAGLIVGTFGSAWPVTGQQPACLHGPDATQEHIARRQRALGLTRHINTLEAREGSVSKKYQPLHLLPITEGIPQGFTIHLATDGESYAFSVKDTLDPCAFGFFSDEGGRIYRGEGIR